MPYIIGPSCPPHLKKKEHLQKSVAKIINEKLDLSLYAHQQHKNTSAHHCFLISYKISQAILKNKKMNQKNKN